MIIMLIHQLIRWKFRRQKRRRYCFCSHCCCW